MWAGWVGLLGVVLVGLGASTCGPLEGVLIPCDTWEDCQDHPGTSCTHNMCVCANEGLRFCKGSCRPIAECWQGLQGAGSGAGGGGGAGGGTGGVLRECATAADCRQPGDPRCGKATCSDGVCGLELRPLSRLTSQLAGDCKERWCDGQGNLVEFTESSDSPNDGAQCTVHSCQGRQPVSSLVLTGLTCPETGAGVCDEGDCVACIPDLTPCGGGLICVAHRCIAMHCTNNQWDLGSGETALNCGGPCLPCSAGKPCEVSSDCFSGVCTNKSCQAPTCSDGVRNDGETGVDCGGPPSCPRCPSGQGCRDSLDCISLVCWAGVCEPSSCTDGILNGDEIGEDCGGSCQDCP
jgi:hypothetical protein